MTTISSPLNPEQEAACSMLLSAIANEQNAAVLGIAGSGKTYSVAGLLHLLKDGEKTVCVVAPTHRAVSVLQQLLHNAGLTTEVRTMHSAIYKPLWKQPLLGQLADWLRTASEAFARSASYPTPQWLLDVIAPGQAASDPLTAKQVHDFFHGADLSLKDEDMVAAALKAARIDPLNVLLDVHNPQTTDGWVPRTEMLAEVIIADESSMLLQGQASDLSRLCNTLIVIGDPLQLPPVSKNRGEDGALDPEYMESLGMTVSTLTQNMRQSGTGGAQIADLGGRLRKRALEFGDVTFEMVRNTMYAAADEPGSAISFRDDWPLIDILRGTPAIVWRNNRRHSLNVRVRSAAEITPDTLGIGEQLIVNWIPKSRAGIIEDPDMRLTVNSLWRVAALEADYTTLIDAAGNKVKAQLRMDHPDLDQLADLREYDPDVVPLMPKLGSWGLYVEPAWGLTCHKMQGAEADHVLISWSELGAISHSRMGLKRGTDGIPAWVKWFYTALTRARSRVTFVRNERTLSPAKWEDIADALSDIEPNSSRPIL